MPKKVMIIKSRLALAAVPAAGPGSKTKKDREKSSPGLRAALQLKTNDDVRQENFFILSFWRI